MIKWDKCCRPKKYSQRSKTFPAIRLMQTNLNGVGHASIVLVAPTIWL